MTIITLAWAALILGAFASFMLAVAYGQWATGPEMRTPKVKKLAARATPTVEMRRRVVTAAAQTPKRTPAAANLFRDKA